MDEKKAMPQGFCPEHVVEIGSLVVGWSGNAEVGVLITYRFDEITGQWMKTGDAVIRLQDANRIDREAEREARRIRRIRRQERFGG